MRVISIITTEVKMPKIEVPFMKDGKLAGTKTGELVNIVRQSEPWSEYVLDDGTVIRTKQTVLKLVRMDEPDAKGKPIYSMQSQPIIDVIPKIEEEKSE